MRFKFNETVNNDGFFFQLKQTSHQEKRRERSKQSQSCTKSEEDSKQEPKLMSEEISRGMVRPQFILNLSVLKTLFFDYQSNFFADSDSNDNSDVNLFTARAQVESGSIKSQFNFLVELGESTQNI